MPRVDDVVVVSIGTKSGSRQQVPSGPSVQVLNWVVVMAGPQQSPSSQLHAQLLFASLHFRLARLAVFPKQVDPQLIAVDRVDYVGPVDKNGGEVGRVSEPTAFGSKQQVPSALGVHESY